MFAIQCTTCGSKLAVKNDELIGQILACPKCGGMVLIEAPTIAEQQQVPPISQQSSPSDSPPTILKKFPEAFAIETESGIINRNENVREKGDGERNLPTSGNLPEKSTQSTHSHEPPVFPIASQSSLSTDMSEGELKTRKLMLKSLAGLFMLLLTAVGVLIVFKGNRPDDQAPDVQTTGRRPSTITDVSQGDTTIGVTSDKTASGEANSFTVLSANMDENQHATSTPDPLKPKISDMPENAAKTTNAPPTLETITLETALSETSSPEKPSTEQEKLANLLSVLKADVLNDHPDASPSMISDENLLSISKSTSKSGLNHEGNEESGKENDAEATTSSDVSSNDFLRSIQRKLPGLIEQSAVLTLDIPQRLAQPLVEFNANGTPLLAVVQTLSTLTEIPISFDLDEMRCRNISVDTPVNCELQNETLGEILNQILAPLRLTAIVEDGQISLTVLPEEKNKLMERNIDVSDLVAGTVEGIDAQTRKIPDTQLNAERIAEILVRLVDPVELSSERTMTIDAPGLLVEKNILIVKNRRQKIDQMLRLIEQLRVLRGLPPQNDIEGKDLAPEVFGWDVVQVPMTLNYYQPTPLAGILSQFEKSNSLRILVDHRALHRALTPLNTIRATVLSNHVSVNETLERLLHSVDSAALDYRIVTANLLEVSTRDALRDPNRMTVEIHRFEAVTAQQLPKQRNSPQVMPRQMQSDVDTSKEQVVENFDVDGNVESIHSVDDLVSAIRTSLEPDSWVEPGQPNPFGLGDIIVDRPSGCLIVRQSQPIQRQLRLWLGKKLD